MRRTSFTLLASAGALVSACGTSARLEASRREQAMVTLSTIEMAAELGFVQTGRYPASLEQLDLKHKNDPWGRPFAYAVMASNAGVMVFSLGPDGIGGNADDVRSGALPEGRN